MSYSIFPTFTATNGGPAWPVKKTPSFRTIVQIPANNRGENRISLTPYPIWKFELDFELLKGDYATASSALQTLAGFMGSVQGSYQNWLYSDPYDNAVTAMNFGTGDGATKTFQLTRTIGGMVDLIQNLNGTPTIYVSGSPVTPASISPTGLVTFTSAPANAAPITWTGSFYFLCRFEEDEWADLQEFLSQRWELSSLKFRSVLL
jgi:hypothetical protein